MSKFWSLLRFAALLCVIVTPAALAEVKLKDGTVLPDQPYFVVTYIEAAPSAMKKVEGLIKKHSAASRKEAGSLRFEALQRNGRSNHFLLLEVWADKGAREAHAKSDSTVAFRKALQPLLYSPYDERPHVGLMAAKPGKAVKSGSGAVFAVTHVDIIPPEQFPPCKRQVSETGPCGNAMVEKLATDSRKHKGNLRFDVLTQANRPNHMTLVEVWHGTKDQQAHAVNKDSMNFRDALSGIVPGSGVAADPLFVLNPLTGSLYDEQLYTVIY